MKFSLGTLLSSEQLLWKRSYIWIGEAGKNMHVCSVVSDSLGPQRLQPARLVYPWNFPGKNTGVGCRFLFQGIFLTQRSNQPFLCLLHLLRGQYIQRTECSLFSSILNSPQVHRQWATAMADGFDSVRNGMAGSNFFLYSLVVRDWIYTWTIARPNIKTEFWPTVLNHQSKRPTHYLQVRLIWRQTSISNS